jgi:protein-S-isoprenylcysteine O-methyltransferase Ste14
MEGPQERPAARRRRRVAVGSAVQRLVATVGVIGVGVALGAVLTSQDVDGWIIGLAVSAVSVILTGLLWSAREP